MRQQCKVQVEVRGVTIGGERPVVCLPLMAASRSELLRSAKELVCLGPELLEWRADAYPGITGKEVASLLPELRGILGGVPLLFTCRIESEGGLQAMGLARRLEVIEMALASGEIDIVDFELCNGPSVVAQVRGWARNAGSHLLLSSHDFQATPGGDQILDTFIAAQAAGADIAKVAVMPRKSADVLSLLSACDRARQGAVDIPLVAISMGVMGIVSRVAGALFGSDITFAAGNEVSAPGQLPIEELRRAMAIVLAS